MGTFPSISLPMKQEPDKSKLGCLNVHGCDVHEKRCKIDEVMYEQNLNVTALCETEGRKCLGDKHV